MAKLSRVSRRLRRAFEQELPLAQLDSFTVDYFAGMLEDDLDYGVEREEELAELWSPYLLDQSVKCSNALASRDACRSVIRRFRSGADVSSSTDSLPEVPSNWDEHPSASLGATGTSSSSTSDPAAAACTGGIIEVWGLMEWLQRLSLTHYEHQARAWCDSMGAADVEEVIENYKDFCVDLGLRALEQRRVRKDCEENSPRHKDGTSNSEFDQIVGPGSGRITGLAPQVLGPRIPGNSAVVQQPTVFWAASPPPHVGLRRVESGGNSVPAAVPCLRSRPHRCEHFGSADDPYNLQHEIGAGVTATVYKCTRGESVYAAKALTLSRYRMQRDFNTALEKLHRETEILYTLRHGNVVALYDVVETKEKLYLVMEYVDGGELFDYISKKGALPEHEARYVFLQIVLGLRYIHSKGVVHRDLKPQNVLVEKKNSRAGLLEVKISDFGHSKLVNDGYDMARTQVGTPRFWAPEVAETKGSGYDQRVDLWSLGVLLYVMLEGRYPFDCCDENAGVSFLFDSKLSKEAQKLIQGLVQVRPQERFSLEDCLSHPWLMVKYGPLSRVVGMCEEFERGRRGELERKAMLPRDPHNVQRLRRELQALTVRFKMPARLRRREVALCYSCDENVDHVESAWTELLSLLKTYFPKDELLRRDCCPFDEVSGGLPTVCETDVSEAGNYEKVQLDSGAVVFDPPGRDPAESEIEREAAEKEAAEEAEREAEKEIQRMRELDKRNKERQRHPAPLAQQEDLTETPAVDLAVTPAAAQRKKPQRLKRRA